MESIVSVTDDPNVFMLHRSSLSSSTNREPLSAAVNPPLLPSTTIPKVDLSGIVLKPRPKSLPPGSSPDPSLPNGNGNNNNTLLYKNIASVTAPSPHQHQPLNSSTLMSDPVGTLPTPGGRRSRNASESEQYGSSSASSVRSGGSSMPPRPPKGMIGSDPRPLHRSKYHPTPQHSSSISTNHHTTTHGIVLTSSSSGNASVISGSTSEKRLVPSSLPQLLRSVSPTGIEASTIVYEAQQKKLQSNEERKALIQEYMKEQKRLRKLAEDAEKQARIDQEKRKRESMNNLRLHQQQSVQKSSVSAKAWSPPTWNNLHSPIGKNNGRNYARSPIDHDPYYEAVSPSSRSYENSPTSSENYDSAYTSHGTGSSENGSPFDSRHPHLQRNILSEVDDNKQRSSRIPSSKNPTAGSPTSSHPRRTKSSPARRTPSPNGRLQGTILRQSIYKMAMNTASSDEESGKEYTTTSGNEHTSSSSGRLSPEQHRLLRIASVHSETNSEESQSRTNDQSVNSPSQTEPSTEDQDENFSESSPSRYGKVDDSEALVFANERLRQVDELREQVQTLAKQLALLQQNSVRSAVDTTEGVGSGAYGEGSVMHSALEVPTHSLPPYDAVPERADGGTVAHKHTNTVSVDDGEQDNHAPLSVNTNFTSTAAMIEHHRSVSPPPVELPRIQLPNEKDYHGLDATDRMELFMNRLKEVTEALPNPPSMNYSPRAVTAIENIAGSDEDTNYEAMMASHRQFLRSQNTGIPTVTVQKDNNLLAESAPSSMASDPITRLLLEAIFDSHDEHSIVNAISAKVPARQSVPIPSLPVPPPVTIEESNVPTDTAIGSTATVDQSFGQFSFPSPYISDNQTAADIIKEARDIVHEVTASAARSSTVPIEKIDNRTEPRLSPDELYFRLLASIDGLAAAEEGVTALAALQSAQAEIEAQRQTLSLAAQFQQQSEAAAIAAQLAEIADEANRNMENQQATVQSTLENLYRQQAEKTGEITASLLRELSMAARTYAFNDPNHPTHPHHAMNNIHANHHHHSSVPVMVHHSPMGSMPSVGSPSKKANPQQSFSNIVSDSSYGDYTEEFESEDDRTVREERSRVTLPHGRTGVGRMPSITSALSPRSSIPPEAIPEDVIAEHEGDDSMDAVEIAEDSVLNAVHSINHVDSVHSRIVEEVPEDENIVTDTPSHVVSLSSPVPTDTNQIIALRHSSSSSSSSAIGPVTSPQQSVRSAMVTKSDTLTHQHHTDKRGKSKVKILAKVSSSADRSALVPHDPSMSIPNDGLYYNIDEILQDTLNPSIDTMTNNHDTNELFHRFVTDLKLRQQQDQNLIDLRTRALHNKCSAEIKYIDRQITKRKSKLGTLRQDILASLSNDAVSSAEDIEARYAKLKKKMEKEIVQFIEARRKVALKFKVNQAEISKERADMGARYYRELLNFQQQIGRTKMFEDSHDDTTIGMENSFETYNGKLFSNDSTLDLDLYDPHDRNKRSYDIIADALLAWDQNQMHNENMPSTVRSTTAPTVTTVHSSAVPESTATVPAVSTKITSPKVTSPPRTLPNAANGSVTSPRTKTQTLPSTNVSIVTSPTIVSRESQDDTDDFYEDSFASASRSTENQGSSPSVTTDVPEEIISTTVATVTDNDTRKQLAELELERYMNELQFSSPVKSTVPSSSLFTLSDPIVDAVPSTIDQMVIFDAGIVVDAPVPEPIPVAKMDQIITIEPSDILSSVAKVASGSDGQVTVSTASNQVTKMNMQDIVNSVTESISNDMLSTIIKDTDGTMNPPALSVNATSARAVRPIPSIASPTNVTGIVPVPPGNGSGPIAQMGSPNASALSPRSTTSTPQKSPSSTSSGTSPYGRDDMFLSPNSQQRSSTNAGISPNSASTSFDEEDDLYDFDSNTGLGYNIGGNSATSSNTGSVSVNSTLAPRPSAPGPGSFGSIGTVHTGANILSSDNGKPKDNSLSLNDNRNPLPPSPTAAQVWESDALSFLDELAAVSPPESFLCLDPSKPCLSVELYLAVERDRELHNRGPQTPEEMETLQIRHKLIFDTINEELVRIARNHKHAFAHIRTLQTSAANGNIKAQDSCQRMVQDLSTRIKAALRNRLATLSKSIDHASIHDPSVLVNRVNAIVRHEIKHTDDLSIAVSTENEILQHITDEITESLVNEALQDMVIPRQ